jgi:glycosyltransferase involved in cell wall biosynthesis
VGYAAAGAAKALGVPFLVQPTIHPNQAGDGALDLRLFRRADRLLVHSRFEEGYFRRHGYRQPISVVGNGILDRSDGVAHRFRERYGMQGPLVLYVGRKEPSKGYDLVVQAWVMARRQMPFLNLVCMGPTSSSARPQAQAGLYDLDFCDEQTKHDALAACDCLCVPSEGESFGLIFMEAGRYGKPVIARRLPVLVELLGDQAALLLGVETGFNRVAVTAGEVADGMIQVMNHKALADGLGQNLALVSARFLWPCVVVNFVCAYGESLKRGAGEDHYP